MLKHGCRHWEGIEPTTFHPRVKPPHNDTTLTPGLNITDTLLLPHILFEFTFIHVCVLSLCCCVVVYHWIICIKWLSGLAAPAVKRNKTIHLHNMAPAAPFITLIPSCLPPVGAHVALPFCSDTPWSTVQSYFTLSVMFFRCLFF